MLLPFVVVLYQSEHEIGRATCFAGQHLPPSSSCISSRWPRKQAYSKTPMEDTSHDQSPARATYYCPLTKTPRSSGWRARQPRRRRPLHTSGSRFSDKIRSSRGSRHAKERVELEALAAQNLGIIADAQSTRTGRRSRERGNTTIWKRSIHNSRKSSGRGHAGIKEAYSRAVWYRR